MFDFENELKNLPEAPGVYLMKNSLNKVIYVGKAKILKNRVKQYFQNNSQHNQKTKNLVEQIASFEYIITDTEEEALILENNLIKKYKPKYNIMLKDDKTYPYITVTLKEKFPRIERTRYIKKDGNRYFGSYSSSQAVKNTLELIKKLFPVRTCNKTIDKQDSSKRPCLNYHIGRCSGPCCGKISIEQYSILVKNLCDFLDGKHEDVIKSLEHEMYNLSQQLQYEKAAIVRDRINSIKKISSEQKMFSTSLENRDVIAIAQNETDTCLQLLRITTGRLTGKMNYVYEGVGASKGSEIINSFVKQYYLEIDFIPEEILIQYDIEEEDIIEQLLSKLKKRKVYIKRPQKGEKLSLIKLEEKNANEKINRFS